MPNSNTTPDLPIWPTGIGTFAGGILDVTSGDGIRVAARDIVEIGVKPPRAGRFSLTLADPAGLDSVRTSHWFEPEHEAALRRLVKDLAARKGEA